MVIPKQNMVDEIVLRHKTHCGAKANGKILVFVVPLASGATGDILASCSVTSNLDK